MKWRVDLVPAGLLALLAAACSPEPPPAPQEPVPQRNVLIFLIDTLRVDHLGCYGYGPPTSPRIDAFAADAVRFAQAHSHAPFTTTSHATLFTSTYQDTHGIWNKVPREDGGTDLPGLSDSATTMAEVFRDAGYDTAGFTDGGMLHPVRNLNQGFTTYEARYRGVAERVERALDWLSYRKSKRPFFLFVHTYEAHLPYLPDAELVQRFAPDYQGPLRTSLAMARREREKQKWNSFRAASGFHERFFEPTLSSKDCTPADRAFMVSLYDAEIATVDEQFQRLIGFLRLKGLLENTIVVVTSDHGEEFGEHGVYGHNQVYEELLHVPLIVRLPDGPRGVVREEPVGLVDLMPSLLAANGLAGPDWMQGRVVPLGEARDADSAARPTHELLASANWPEAQLSWRRGERKAILRPGGDRAAQVFDLAADPHEEHDLAADPTQRAFLEEATRALEAWRQRGVALGQRLGLTPEVRQLDELDEENRGELSELGYTDS